MNKISVTNINPDSISQVLSLATIDDLARELRKRGACFAIIRESDVLDMVQTNVEYLDTAASDQCDVAEDIFEGNVEFIQNAMVTAAQEAIADLIITAAADDEDDQDGEG